MVLSADPALAGLSQPLEFVPLIKVKGSELDNRKKRICSYLSYLKSTSILTIVDFGNVY